MGAALRPLVTLSGRLLVYAIQQSEKDFEICGYARHFRNRLSFHLSGEDNGR